MEVLILGAGTFAVEVADILDGGCLRVLGFVVDLPGQPDTLLDLPVWNVMKSNVMGLPLVHRCVVGIVSPERRKIVERMDRLGFEFVNAVHSSASISTRSSIFKGSVVNRLVAVAAGVIIGPFAVLNRGCTVGHDCLIGPFVTIGPGANLAGGVIVGEGSVVGMGANILEGRKIGKDSIVGAGAVVTRDVPDGVRVMGVPAR